MPSERVCGVKNLQPLQLGVDRSKERSWLVCRQALESICGVRTPCRPGRTTRSWQLEAARRKESPAFEVSASRSGRPTIEHSLHCCVRCVRIAGSSSCLCVPVTLSRVSQRPTAQPDSHALDRFSPMSRWKAKLPIMELLLLITLFFVCLPSANSAKQPGE
ncbi:Hypothetical predicted protein [Cloeon dipterum]|uniref:Uncharacterized protein n=1 Tax=Cloeon dipterum TaxID=197152 RepID=A0A8S1CRW0_9INSE|nr:Hypothetical predicted protein [Cloeon dipterum]